MNVAIAIFGLAILILLHEAGHFFVARAVGDEARGASISASRRRSRRSSAKDIEYGVGAIPLGGYVKIPGMHRPAASDVEVQLGPAAQRGPELFPKVGARRARARGR